MQIGRQRNAHINILKTGTSSKRKKRELEQAQRAAEEEKGPWPPVWKPIEESIQFKSGMIDAFTEPFDIEDMDDSDFFSYPNNRAYGDADILNKLKRFFMLVRDTRGYDVDWVPPPNFFSPFRPVDDVQGAMKEDHLFKKHVNEMLECVVDKINSRAKNRGEEYKVLKKEKIVWAPINRMYLMTFSVELVSSSHGDGDGDGGVEKDVQATVRSEGGREYTCVEWRFKPGEDGPSEGSNAAVASDPEPPKKKKTKTLTKT